PQLLQARRLVEGAILERAIERIDRTQAAALEQILAQPAAPQDDRLHLSRLKQIVDRMADLAGSPLLRVLAGSLRHCYVDRVRTTTLDDGAYLRASRTVAELRLRQIEAILAYDRVAARDLQTRAMDVWARFQETVPTSDLSGAAIVNRLTATGDDALIYEFVRPAKKAEGVARAIAQMIASQHLGIGSRVGTEPDLIAALDVSRRVLREGIRILERFGIVESGRGKHGGLIVGQPRPLALPGSFRGELAPSGDDERTIAAMLLVHAVLAVTRDAAGEDGAAARTLAERLRQEARPEADMPAASAPAAQANAAFVTFLLDHLADPVARCLLGVADDLQHNPPAAIPWPAFGTPTLLAVLEAIAANDRFAAPRLVQAALRADWAGTERSRFTRPAPLPPVRLSDNGA
ncbi:MAG: GntR family transcriptional regulator, partial [Alphaproteobacteria bacterium]|nr:GntR family transcriptional regulator [Alphaproteobacteria bacterium]